YEFVGPETFNIFAVTDSEETKALNMAYNATRSLQKGFTTVRITGTAFRGFGCLDVKRAIDKGYFPASRMIVAPHALGTPGGHWDFSIFHGNANPFISDYMEQPYAIGTGADMFKYLVRKQIKYGADFIKIMAAGGFASPGDDPGEMQIDSEELKAIIDTAHLAKKTVIAHAYTSESVDLLIELGIDEIEHGTLINRSTAQLMEKAGISYVPTLFSLMPPDDDIDPAELPPKSEAFVRKLAKYEKQLKESREVVIDLVKNGNIKIGLGSDIVGIYPNHDGWREFKAWVDLGVPPMRALFAATSVNAEIVGRSDLGALLPGKTADISAWKRDFFSDSRAASECAFVMKEGNIYKNIE
ncbi:MAG: amidohydrolase family protein, partial [Clostridia bacterium]|nr:amidohydrolase family protein [Clostridia bacterium]